MATGKIVGMNKNPKGSREDRQGKLATWGDNGKARNIPTKEYKDNYDRIFGKK